MKKILTLTLLIATFSFSADLTIKTKECNTDLNYNSCNFVADTYLYEDKLNSSNLFYSKAKKIMIYECNHNDFTACYNLGVSFELGSLIYPKSNKKAMVYYNKRLSYFKKSCEKGNLNACYKLGMDYSDKGILNNPEKASKYFSIACSKGNEISCERLKK